MTEGRVKNCGGDNEGMQEITAVYSVVFQCTGNSASFEVFSTKGYRAPEHIISDLVGAASRLRAEWRTAVIEEVCHESGYQLIERDHEGTLVNQDD